MVSTQIANYTNTSSLPNRVKHFVEEPSRVQISNNVEEAIKEPKWIEAMETEMKALETTQTWKLVELPSEKKTVGCK